MKAFDEGDRVRTDIPDETDADHGLHGETGTVVDVIRDGAGLCNRRRLSRTPAIQKSVCRCYQKHG